ncbi:hypothetical protein HJ192_13080 [Vibrio parahaemolyticus]|nr:hypothetical protein [Vibrio parahaemolyticus]
MSGGDNENWDKIIKEYLFINPFKNIKINGNEPADYLRDIAVIFEQEGDIDTAKKANVKCSSMSSYGISYKKQTK